MRASRSLGVLIVLSLPFLAVVSPARANQSLSGTVTDTDPLVTISEPNWTGDAQGCPSGSAASTTAVADTVTYVAKSTGLRTVTLKVDPAHIDDVAIYLYRNGQCAAADFEADNASEASAGILDLVNVPVKFGETVKVVIASFSPPTAWTATITEPASVTGKATHKTTGKAKKYLTFPKAINCGNHHATVKLKKKAKKNARSVVFKAGSKKLKKITHIKTGKKVLKHIPAKTTKLKATVTLKSGKKITASRTYNRCL